MDLCSIGRSEAENAIEEESWPRRSKSMKRPTQALKRTAGALSIGGGQAESVAVSRLEW